MGLAFTAAVVALSAAFASAAAGFESEKVVAVDLGTCHGKRAYLKDIWYFPAYRKAPSRRQANPACI